MCNVSLNAVAYGVFEKMIVLWLTANEVTSPGDSWASLLHLCSRVPSGNRPSKVVRQPELLHTWFNSGNWTCSFWVGQRDYMSPIQALPLAHAHCDISPLCKESTSPVDNTFYSKSKCVLNWFHCLHSWWKQIVLLPLWAFLTHQLGSEVHFQCCCMNFKPQSLIQQLDELLRSETDW